MEEPVSFETFGIYPSSHMESHPRSERLFLRPSDLLVHINVKAGREHSYVNC